MLTYKDLGIPPSDVIVDVQAFNIYAQGLYMPASWFISPILPGREKLGGPILCFLIEHHASKKRLLFDLGMRKDKENLAPAIVAMLTHSPVNLPVDEDLIDMLHTANIPLESIDKVIWSHTHFDHIGDISKFPSSTELVVGKGSNREYYPLKPDAGTQESDWTGRTVTEIDFDQSSLSIGGYQAVDYLGDGSFYLLNTPGHMAGHIAALCRVTPTDFVFLGGDTCHHAGQIRPTERLHKHLPCPGELVARANKNISCSHFAPGADKFDLEARKDPLLDIPDHGAYSDPETARKSIQTLTVFDGNPDVFIMLAHDESLLEIVDANPVRVNDWKAKGWKTKATWDFVDPDQPHFRLSAVETANS